MESKRTATTYFIPPGKFLLMENALGNPDLIQSSVSSDCRVTIVDSANFPLDDLEQWPTFRLSSADIVLNLGEGQYYIYIVVPTPDNTDTNTAFVSYNTSRVDRNGYDESGKLLGKAGFKYYECGTVSERGGAPTVNTTPAGEGRLIEMDLGVTPSPSTLPGDLNDYDKIFQIDKIDPSVPGSWLLTILATVKEMTARLIRVTGSIVFGSGENEKHVKDVATSPDVKNEAVIDDTILPTTAWVQAKFNLLDERYLRKDKDDRSVGIIATDKALEVGKFVAGASGAIIQVDKNTGQTMAELDKLYVRMKAYFETLEIINVNSIGGKMILSPAGSVTCLGVEELEDAYRCYFLGEQDGEIVENRWQVGMQAYSQMFNAKVGVSNKVSNVYYWRLVTGVSEDTVDYNNQKCHYIDLSKTDRDYNVGDNGEIIFDSDVPKAGDVINHRGSRTDTDYMNFIEFSSVGVNAPYITLFQGVNSYSLVGKEYVQFGYDQSTGKAYMTVYGDMYVGDRNETSYMRYTQEGGLEIKGKLSVGTTLGGKDLQDMINAASPEGYQEFVDSVTKTLGELQNQIDGAIDSYFFDYAPATDNYPAMEWTTEAQKEAHIGDTFTNNISGESWRWGLDAEGNYAWIYIEDTATKKALAAASKAQDTADGKRRVFTSQPTPPYDEGDLWAGGEDSFLMKCVVAKSSGKYDAADWDYADNNAKLLEEMQSLVQDTKDELNNAIGKATEAANTYTDEAKAAVEESIDALNKAKANVDDVYTQSQVDGKISDSEKAAIDAAKKAADAAIELSEITVKVYADGVVDEEEQARIKQAEENLAAAKKYAEEKAQEAFDSAMDELNKFDYLKAALKEDTTIDGGLIQSSLLQLGYTDGASLFKVMSGTNGLYNPDSHGGGVASWWGGGLHDLLDYYTWNGQWVAKEGVNIPANIPSGLIRFDGTGYFAKGKFWWDDKGEIHADPTALLLSFDVETGDETLASTIINIRKDIAAFTDMWEVKTDLSGNKYLYSKRPIATNGGVTMYANTGDLNIPSIYNGLPIDGDTIYWQNGVLKAKGGTGGGTADSVHWDNVEGKPTWIGTTKPSYAWSEITGKPTFATVATSGKYSDLSGLPDLTVYAKAADLSSYQTKITSTNKLDYSLISGTPTSLKNPNALSIKNSSGTEQVSYDGSAAKSLTLTKSMVGLGNVENTALSSWVGSSKITTLGTISSGTWNGTKIANTYLANSAITISGTSVSLGGSITQAALRTALGLGSNAYTSTAYLPLSGGTISNTTIGLTINRQFDNTPWIEFQKNGVSIGRLGMEENQPVWYKSSTNITYKVWCEFNDGAGSGLDADLLDGVENGLLTARYISCGYIEDGNSAYNANCEMRFYSQIPSTAINIPTYNGYQNAILSMGLHNMGSTAQFFFSAGHPLYYRSLYNGKWNQIAYIDDNVASATKLQTARTIWGQSFDGTGDISGALSGVSSISMNGSLEGVTNINSKIYLTTSGYIGVGNSTPTTYLDVKGDSIEIGKSVYSTGGISSQIYMSTHRESSTLGVRGLRLAVSGTTVGRFQSFSIHSKDYGTLVSLFSLDSSGNLSVTGGITMYSDIRKKTKLQDVELTLSQIANAPLIEHYYNSDDKRTTHVGSIAQYWAGLNDWFCKLDNEGFYTMEIQNAALASAISIARELQRYESKTDRKIRLLKKRITELEDKIESLEKKGE